MLTAVAVALLAATAFAAGGAVVGVMWRDRLEALAVDRDRAAARADDARAQAQAAVEAYRRARADLDQARHVIHDLDETSRWLARRCEELLPDLTGPLEPALIGAGLARDAGVAW